MPLKNVGSLARCDCGSDAILSVEAVPSVGVNDQSVPTADFDAFLGLITCERGGVGQTGPRWPNSNSPCGVAQGDLQTPVIGSAVGVEGGGTTSRSGR